ncbi:hypothetical protein [Paenibacillus sp. PL2-23]
MDLAQGNRDVFPNAVSGRGPALILWAQSKKPRQHVAVRGFRPASR